MWYNRPYPKHIGVHLIPQIQNVNKTIKRQIFVIPKTSLIMCKNRNLRDPFLSISNCDNDQ